MNEEKATPEKEMYKRANERKKKIERRKLRSGEEENINTKAVIPLCSKVFMQDNWNAWRKG